jgi:phosphate transport system substrate-binding protein
MCRRGKKGAPMGKREGRSASPVLRSAAALLAVGGLLVVRGGIPAARAGEPGGNVLRVTGSSTMCPMIGAIRDRFASVRRDVRIDVQCGGSDRGIKDIRDRAADIAMLSRALKAEEDDLLGFPMARDGVSLIVHGSNPLTSLSEEQIAGIFTGKIGSWRTLTGKNAPITVILREKEKPVTELFEKHFKIGGSLRGKTVPGDNPVTISAVAADPDAIGYVSSGEAERNVKSGAAIRLVSVGGVTPTERNVITGNYPLTRPLSLVTRELPAGATKEFIDYCLSSKVVDLIERFGFAPYED